MANREALKELQTRLAARLQAAKAENITVASWLAVESGARRFLLPLAQAGEDVFFRQITGFQVFVGQRFIGFGSGLHHFHAPFIRRGLQLGGSLGCGIHTLPDDLLHVLNRAVRLAERATGHD